MISTGSVLHAIFSMIDGINAKRLNLCGPMIRRTSAIRFTKIIVLDLVIVKIMFLVGTGRCGKCMLVESGMKIR